jgi:ATP-dependent exoDNAse (exonuclease V) alpha subunit
MKYCFTVPSSYLVLRRKDKIFITCNCGKSASIKNLVRMADENNLSVLLLSTTGKASKVLSESVGGRKAMTLHKACYGEINNDIIILDECGMASLEMFIMLIRAIKNPNAKIVCVGDEAQLSAINGGKLFYDFINSNIIPTTKLTEVFRYKSDGSLFVATNLRNGTSFFDNEDMIKYNNGEYKVANNYRFIEQNTEEDILNCVVKEYMNMLNKGIKQSDILILSPQNVGTIGTYKINQRIQEIYNPPKPNEKILTRKIGNHEIVFRVGDMVINTKNDYNAISESSYREMTNSDGVLSENEVADLEIMNGQMGIIREVIDKVGLIVQFDEDLVFVSKHKLINLLLSYSISVFKAQGSSVDYTISIVTKAHKRLLTRGLLYVADTRCRKAHIDIGEVEAFENALTVVDNDLRNTYLKDLLQNSN